MANPVVEEKVCIMCGTIMHNVSPQKLYCKECIRKRKNKQKREYRAFLKQLKEEENADKEKLEEKVSPPSQSPPQVQLVPAAKVKPKERVMKDRKLTLGEIAKLATDAGMTYGEYVAKHGL